VTSSSDASQARRVAVIGAGTMGTGIAQVCLASGFEVVLHDARREALDAAPERIARGLARAAGGTPEPVPARLHTSSTLVDAAAEADVVLEAIFEDAALKARTWKELGAAAPAAALLGTNTSSLSVTELARASGRPERFIGLHFFNPVPVMPLVEVVRADTTPDPLVEEAVRFAGAIGKTPVVCADRPGFLVNRLLIPYLNEAAQLWDDGAADATSIDRAMNLGANVPIGPLALADLIGIDVVLSVMENLQAEFGDPRYRPAQVLRRMVRAGRLGRKSGTGFHQYGGDE